MTDTPVRSILRAEAHYHRCRQAAWQWEGRKSDWGNGLVLFIFLSGVFAFKFTFWTLALSLPLGVLIYFSHRRATKQWREAMMVAEEAFDDFRSTLETALEKEAQLIHEATEELGAY